MAQLDTALVPDASFLFRLGGVTPLGDGTVTISNLQGDIDSPTTEQWTIRLGSIGSGVRLEGDPALGGREWTGNGAHRTGQALAERNKRELQRQVPGRVPGDGVVPEQE
jgi:hypothetical protein